LSDFEKLLQQAFEDQFRRLYKMLFIGICSAQGDIDKIDKVQERFFRGLTLLEETHKRANKAANNHYGQLPLPNARKGAKKS